MGTPFELDGQLVMNSTADIGASLPFGEGTSVDETHTTALALSASVPLISESGASYAGATSVPEPSTLSLVSGMILIISFALACKQAAGRS